MMAGDGEAGIDPFARIGPAGAPTPLVLAVPHAGRHYPPAVERDRAVPRAVLEQLEDRHADRLVSAATAAGAVAIVATVARAWIDLNRGETEIGEAAGRRARAGLGLVPTRLGGRPLWRAPPPAEAIAARLAAVHRPYHAAIAEALAAARARHGFAVLVDCHSMPPLGQARAWEGARIVIGDRHGASAAPAVAQAAVAAAAAGGLAVARNVPYAGAFTLERHGRPDARVDALQAEFDRSLYLAPGLREPGPGVTAAAATLAALAWAAVAAAAAAAAAGRDMLAIAAE